MILIMGMGSQMIGWDDEFCLQLAGKGFYVIRFDNRDVGRSSRLHHLGVPDVRRAMTRAWLGLPVDAPYKLQDMTGDLFGLMDALNIQKAHIVGASMGGGIAQYAAIYRPDRVLSMTSIMSTTGDPDLPRPDSSAVAAVGRPAPSTLEDYVDYYVSNWKKLRVDRFPEEVERDRKRAIHNFERGLSPEGGGRHLMAILASGSRRNALRNVTVPTLVIHGDIDPLVPLAAGVDTAKCILEAQLLVLEGMGHSMPERLWPTMIKAIAGLASRV